MSQSALTLDDCKTKLPRAHNLIGCFEFLAASGIETCTYLEIGCCFKEDEGLSTFVAAKFIADQFADGRVISLEMDPGHIESSKAIVMKYEPALMDRIAWTAGASLASLPRVLQSAPQIDFAFVDGGAGPSTNLAELLLIWDRLSVGGIILIDDCTYLHPTEAYEGRRDFGKAQLILPFLLLVEHINYSRRAAAKKFGKLPSDPAVSKHMATHQSATAFTTALYESPSMLEVCRQYEDMDFLFCGPRQLIVAHHAVIEKLRADKKSNRVDF